MKRKTTLPKGVSAKEKKQTGRPTKFDPAYCALARKVCMLGATDVELAGILEVAEMTITRWKKEHPEFMKALSEGKMIADAEMAHSLYRRGIGYDHPEVHVSNYQGEITLTDLTKHYPPDTAAASLWLRNRRPQNWRDKVEVTGGSLEGDKPIEHNVKVELDFEAVQKRREVLKKAASENVR